jgi:hypothetical protein
VAGVENDTKQVAPIFSVSLNIDVLKKEYKKNKNNTNKIILYYSFFRGS